MSYIKFTIDTYNLKNISVELNNLISDGRKKNGSLKLSIVKKVKEYMLNEFNNNIPNSILREFKDKKIVIDIQFNEYNNHFIFDIKWSKQNFIKMGNYEIIHDFNNFFCKDFRYFLRDYEESIIKKTNKYFYFICS
jgi:hypothetical protein